MQSTSILYILQKEIQIIMYIRHIIILISCHIAINKAEMQEICNGEEFHGTCSTNEVMLVNNALFGRMRLGRCVTKDFGQLGCQNDVLSLADMWCSGRQECTVNVANSNADLASANEACKIKDLTPYFEVDYRCVQVPPMPSSRCYSGSVPIYSSSGFLSSHVTEETGCGTSNAPYAIKAKHGQTIELWMIDFGALSRQGSDTGTECSTVYGHIIEREVGVNLTICAGSERRKWLYRSKGQTTEIRLNTGSSGSDGPGFMIEYNIVGCADPVPPAHAWFRRDDNEAVIGCDFEDKEWKLECKGHVWTGLVGNCTQKTKEEEPEEDTWSQDVSFSSVILLTGVVCGAVLLILIVIVAGMVYIKKQSIKHEMSLKSQYSGATLQPLSYKTSKNPGYDGSTLRSDTTQIPGPDDNQPLVHIWDRFSNKPMTGDTLSHVPNVQGHNTTRSVHDNLLN